MLLRLLDLVAGARGVVTLREMARELGVSRGLVDAMIADAVRFGYLAPMQKDCCHQPCPDCVAQTSCHDTTPSGFWLLTDKGKRVLTKG